MELTDKGKEIKRDGWKTGRERKRRHVLGEVLVPFEEDTGAAQSQQTSKPPSLKPCLETGAPPPSPPSSSSSSFFSSLSVSLTLSFSLASTQPLKTAGRETSEREEERGGDKRTQREKDQPCRQQKAPSVESNGQCLFLESIFFCCCSSSISDVVLLFFFMA